MLVSMWVSKVIYEHILKKNLFYLCAFLDLFSLFSILISLHISLPGSFFTLLNVKIISLFAQLICHLFVDCRMPCKYTICFCLSVLGTGYATSDFEYTSQASTAGIHPSPTMRFYFLNEKYFQILLCSGTDLQRNNWCYGNAKTKLFRRINIILTKAFDVYWRLITW